MQLKKLRANEVPLIIREKRVIRNLFHSANARLLDNLSPQLSEWILKRHLGKPASHSLALPIAYAKAALAEHLTLHIDPTRLTHRLHDWVSSDEDEQPRHMNDYFLCFADWSSALKPIARSPVYIEAIQLLDAGLDYTSTKVYRRYIKRLKRARYPTRNKARLDTQEKIELYFQRFTSLFHSIKSHGFMKLEEVRRVVRPLKSISAIRSWRTDLGEANLGVALGEAGELVALPGGQHRLAIAVALKLPSIPVELRLLRQSMNADFNHSYLIETVTSMTQNLSMQESSGNA